MSASSGRTSSKAKKLWNSSQLQKAPTCGKCFNNHIPKVAVWAGVASAPLPHPFFQWVQWGKREARKGQCAQPVSPSPAAHPQEGTYDTQTRRKKWWRPRKHSCNSPYLTYKEAFNKIPKVSQSPACITCEINFVFIFKNLIPTSCQSSYQPQPALGIGLFRGSLRNTCRHYFNHKSQGRECSPE